MAQRRRDVLKGARALGVALALAAPAAFAEAPPADAGAAEAQAAAPVVLLPTVTPAGDGLVPRPLRRPGPADAPLADRAQELDQILGEGVQDFGLTLDLSDRTGGMPAAPRDADLVARAAKGPAWVISPRVEAVGADLLVRIVAVPPGSKVALVRAERVKPGELAVRAVVMLRDLVVHDVARTGPTPAQREEEAEAAPSRGLARPARSAGRSILAVNGAVFGGAVGYAIQRSSGSDDPRLLYPLMALGTGFGLGGSLIVAEEWDVGVGDAWYLSAAAWWPAAGGLALAAGRDVQPTSDRWAYGLVGAGAGVGLATAALAVGGGMGEGGALLTHSGGALGTFLGGMTELSIHGSTEGNTPYRGAGWGAGAGVLLAGAAAQLGSFQTSRVLAADLSAGLGGLAGAAAASPFLFGRRTEGRERTFLVTTMSTTVVGGVVGWALGGRGGGRAHLDGTPMAGVVATSWGPHGEAVPVLGAGWQGAF